MMERIAASEVAVHETLQAFLETSNLSFQQQPSMSLPRASVTPKNLQRSASVLA